MLKPNPLLNAVLPNLRIPYCVSPKKTKRSIPAGEVSEPRRLFLSESRITQIPRIPRILANPSR